MHEVDQALIKARAGDAAGRNATTGGPHNVDEAWGIWAGDGSGSVCTLSGLAKLGANAAKAPSVDPAVLAAVQAAYAASLSGDAAALERAREAIISKAIVLPETLLLLAAAQSIDAVVKAGASPAALQATAYSYFRTISPLIGADSDAAKAVLAAIHLGGAPAANVFTAIRDVVPAWAGRFGITDADLGASVKPAPPAPAPVKPATKCATARSPTARSPPSSTSASPGGPPRPAPAARSAPRPIAAEGGRSGRGACASSSLAAPRSTSAITSLPAPRRAPITVPPLACSIKTSNV
jgi:hypothetical protein